MKFLKALIGTQGSKQDDPNYSKTIERIEKSLDGLPEKQGLFLACFALLLTRVANADLDISENEKERIKQALMQHGGLSLEQSKVVESIAVESTLKDAVENHLVVRKLNEIVTRDQKTNIIRALLHIACADDLTEIESNQIALIAQGLMLTRSEFLALRSEFREHLSILKNLPKNSG